MSTVSRIAVAIRMIASAAVTGGLSWWELTVHSLYGNKSGDAATDGALLMLFGLVAFVVLLAGIWQVSVKL